MLSNSPRWHLPEGTPTYNSNNNGSTYPMLQLFMNKTLKKHNEINNLIIES